VARPLAGGTATAQQHRWEALLLVAAAEEVGGVPAARQLRASCEPAESQLRVGWEPADAPSWDTDPVA
jgi:hypothetical protein